MVGANINTPDKDGKTPLTHCLESCQIENEETHTHLYFMRLLTIHVHKLSFLDLDVSEINRSCYVTACQTHRFMENFNENLYHAELCDMENIEFSDSFTLRDFMSEQAIKDFPRMPRAQRQAIVEIVHSRSVLGKFPELRALLKLQLRKALARMELMEPARASLGFLAGFELPDLCSEPVLSYLSNEDLSSLGGVTIREGGTCERLKVE